jgi:tetratricopeptide (TPR) repeat protein
MHNAGVEAAQQGRLVEAEDYFNRALLKNPDAAITWLARGITRSQQAKTAAAQQDVTYAAALFEQQGDMTTALGLRDQLKKLEQKEKQNAGNGYGSGLLRTAGGLFQQLAPLALKLFAPTPF